VAAVFERGAEGLPFAPFTAVVRELTREGGLPGVIELLGGWAGEMAWLLPGLGAAAREPGAPAGAGGAGMLAAIERALRLVVGATGAAARATVLAG
jgi:hypothetical protein